MKIELAYPINYIALFICFILGGWCAALSVLGITKSSAMAGRIGFPVVLAVAAIIATS